MSQAEIFASPTDRRCANGGKLMAVVYGSSRVMPGYTDKSRRYLRLADEQTHRAETALGPHTRSMFLALARQYRELAGQIDDIATPTDRRFIRVSGWIGMARWRRLFCSSAIKTQE